MADPFGIIGVIGVAVQIIQIGVQFGLDWKDAPAETKSFIAELEVLKTVLAETKRNILDNKEFVGAFQGRNSALISHLGDGDQATDTSLLVSTCRTELETVLENLKKRCQGHRAGWERIKGAFQARKTREAVENLYRHCQALNNMAVIDTASLGASTYNIVDQIQRRQEMLSLAQNDSALRERKSALLRRLYKSPYRDRKDRNPERVDGTCEWFTNHLLFRDWQTTESSALLWVSADPGCGKSVLAKHLVDNVLQSSTTRTICYFFFKDDFEDQRSLESCVCSILRQIFIQRPGLLSDEILERFEADGERLLDSFSDLWDIFIDISTGEVSREGDTHVNQPRAEIICLLDALDECQEKGQRQLIEAFRRLEWGQRNSSVLKFLLTSRPHVHIQRAISSLGAIVPTIHLSGESEVEVEKISLEINAVINFRIGEVATRLDLLPEEQRILEDELTGVPNRTYLWVHLVFDIIQESIDITEESLRAQIRELPKTVEAAYEKILSRSRDPGKAKKLLHIIVAAERPLSLDEMALALAIKENHRACSDLKLEPANRFRNTVREICGLIVVIIDSKIYLLHQTVKEFLVQRQPCDLALPQGQEPRTLQWRFSLRPEDSHRVLAEICMWRLLWTDDESARVDWPGKLHDFFDSRVMLTYSAENWATHLKEAHLENDTASVSLAYRLFYCGGNSRFWSRIRCDKADIDLIVATRMGLESMVRKFLLAGDIFVNSTGAWRGRTALACAVDLGHDKIVELLIGTPGVDINAKDRDQRTPLLIAAEVGRQSIVKMLLDASDLTRFRAGAAKLDVDWADSDGDTALAGAAREGHSEVVRLLLTQGNCDPQHRDQRGRTPLFHAAWQGHISIVKLLLESGKVDVNCQDNDGWTPLLAASGGGYVNIVKILLESGKVDVNCQDNDSWTPLLVASGLGHVDIVKILLESGKVDVNCQDKYGRTPLFTVSERGHVNVVKILLESGKVDVNCQDKDGWTPLFAASRWGYVDIVKILLTVGKADPQARDLEGNTPLWYATNGNHEGVVRLLQLECSQHSAS